MFLANYTSGLVRSAQGGRIGETAREVSYASTDQLATHCFHVVLDGRNYANDSRTAAHFSCFTTPDSDHFGLCAVLAISCDSLPCDFVEEKIKKVETTTHCKRTTTTNEKQNPKILRICPFPQLVFFKQHFSEVVINGAVCH